MTEENSQSTAPPGDNLDKYLTRKRSEVVSNLIELSRNREPLTILLDSGRHSFPTSVIELKSDNTEVVFERANKEEMNARLTELKAGTVIGQPGGIKIRFLLEQVAPAVHNGEKVFVAPLPTEHYRMQRRELFRIDTQVRDPVQVDVTLPDGTVVTLTAGNISRGGLRLDDVDHVLDCEEAELFTQCNIRLPDAEPFPADLLVRNAYEKKKLNGKLVQHIGCEYRNLHASHEREIEGYIHRLQLAELAVKK
ncbi:MAG: hypothetical protein Hals2KO_35780 [Halioglobus sp.]